MNASIPPLKPISGIRDFETPFGKVEAMVELIPREVKDRVCAVCKGSRKAAATLLSEVHVLWLKGPQPNRQRTWDQMHTEMPTVTASIESTIHHSGIEKPVCTSCMEDFHSVANIRPQGA